MEFVGARKFAKKDGSGFCYMVTYKNPLSDREKDAGSFGMGMAENFVTEEIFNDLAKQQDVILGKEFVFEFGMSTQGRPYIIGLRFASK